MHKTVAEICDQLDAMSTRLVTIANADQRFSVANWNHPTLTPRQLSTLPAYLAEMTRSANVEEITDSSEKALQDALQASIGLNNELVPNLVGNPAGGAAGYLNTLSYISIILGSVHGWATVGPSSLPHHLARKLNKTQRDLDAILPATLEIEKKISTIIEATDAAEALPTTLQELKATQAEVRKISSTASEFLGKIEQDESRSKVASSQLEKYAAEGSVLVDKVSDAYSITTTVGLAASFEARATNLNNSLYLWVAGLAIALIGIMIVGYFRLTAMKEALAVTPFEGSRVWIQLFLSLLSVGAPIWFAWIATKQISQRFRLAEDYGFKATVAKAYEGYRREAVRLDSAFEKALFASALKRLDESPAASRGDVNARQSCSRTCKLTNDQGSCRTHSWFVLQKGSEER